MIKDHLALRRELEKLFKIKVKGLMPVNVVSITSDQPIVGAVTLITKHKVNRLLVIDNGKLVGIITRADVD